MAAMRKPKSDGHKHPWIARDGEYAALKPQAQTAAQKKATAEFNEFFGLNDDAKPKKPVAKKPTKKK